MVYEVFHIEVCALTLKDAFFSSRNLGIKARIPISTSLLEVIVLFAAWWLLKRTSAELDGMSFCSEGRYGLRHVHQVEGFRLFFFARGNFNFYVGWAFVCFWVKSSLFIFGIARVWRCCGGAFSCVEHFLFFF